MSIPVADLRKLYTAFAKISKKCDNSISAYDLEVGVAALLEGEKLFGKKN